MNHRLFRPLLLSLTLMAGSVGFLVPTSALAFDELHLEWDFFIQGGGVLVDSVGLATRAGGPIEGIVTVDDLPDRASITQAFLYWMTIGGTGDGEVMFEGNVVVGLEVGDCLDTCWGIGPNYVYRADITQYVVGAGDYLVGGVGVGNGTAPDGQGATILTFYDDPSALSAGFIKIYEGARDNMPNSGDVAATYTTFDGLFLPVDPVRAEMTWSVGDSQPFPDGDTTFEGVVIDSDNFDDSQQGPLWDTDEWDVLPYMSAGMTEVTAGISVGGGMDCLAIGLAILEYDLPCDYDADGDGSGICEDCDDSDPSLDDLDVDGDSRSLCDGDCDDNADDVYPGHPEVCDGVDNDCDGVIPEDEFIDGDGDGYLLCLDCDDASSAVNPGVAEICENGIDDNCNSVVDEQDCTGGGDDDDDSAGSGEGSRSGSRGGGCGCQSGSVDAPGSASWGLLFLLGLWAGGRRRSTPPSFSLRSSPSPRQRPQMY